MIKSDPKLIISPTFMTNYLAVSFYENEMFSVKNKYMDEKECKMSTHLRPALQTDELPAKKDEFIDVEGFDAEDFQTCGYNPQQQYPQGCMERQSYYDPDIKPTIGKSVQLQCALQGQQHSMDPKQGYFYPGGNHQVPGEDDSMNYDSGSNDFYEMSKHNTTSQMGHTEEMYQPQPQPTQNGYPNPQALHLPISESLPIPRTPYSIPTTGSAPTSPSVVGYDVSSQQYLPSSSSPDYQDQILSPFPQYSMGGDSFQYPGPDGMGMTPTRMSSRDPKYCERRRKNNEASKKSRAKKKEKAKEMESRAYVLEEENRQLRLKQSELEHDVAGYKQLIEQIKSTDHMDCNTAAIQAFQQQKEIQQHAPQMNSP